MKGPGSMVGRLFGSIAAPVAWLALAGLFAAPASAANWSHPVIGVHATPAPAIIVTHGGAVTVKGTTGSSHKGDLTIDASSGSASSTATVVTKTTVGANGASETTKTIVTTYGATKDIVVAVTYTNAEGGKSNHTFTFSSLSEAPKTFGTAPAFLIATPSQKNNTVTVKLTRGHQSSTTKTTFGSPLVLKGTTGSSKNGEVTIGSVSGDSVTTITTTTTPVLDANGATTTTVKTKTAHAKLTNITITVTYTMADDATGSHTFTFASLSSPAQTYGSAPDIIKATPSAKTGTITVVHIQGKAKQPPSVTVTLGSPDTLAGTTGADKTLTVDKSAGQSVTTITTKTDPTLEPDGATKTTTTVVTTHGKASDVTVSGTYTTLAGVTLPYSFIFPSLSWPAKTKGTFPATVTATPDAANHTVTIAFTDGPPKPKNSTTVTTGATQTVNGGTKTNAYVSVSSLSASTTPVTTTTTKETLNPDGSVTSVTTTVTKYTDPTAIMIAGAYNENTAPYNFTFANMTAAAHTISLEGGEISFTPNAAKNAIDVVVTFGETVYAHYSVALQKESISQPITSTSAPPTTTTFVSTIAPPPDTTRTSSSTTTPPTTSTVVSTLTAPPPPSTTSTHTTTPPQFVISTLPPPSPTETTADSGTPPIPPEANPTPAPEPVGNGPQELATGAAGEAQIEIARCGVETPPCVADALDAYAAQLDKIVPNLPPQMRNLPNVIRETARKVRSAKSEAEARRYLQAAIVAVRHTISLLRADDPDARAFGVEVGTQAVGVLQSASVKLERASQL